METTRPSSVPLVELLEDRTLLSVSFQPTVNYAADAGPVSVAVGDFNGDGKLDLATANVNADNVSVLLGNGNGTFQAPANFAVGHTLHVRGGRRLQRRRQARPGRAELTAPTT